MTAQTTDRTSQSAQVVMASPDDALLGRLAGAIGTLGIGVERVSSASAAVTRLRETRCQLALIDADGIADDVAEYLSELRRNRPDLIVLVMATEPTKRLLLDLIHTKIYDFFPKPISTARLCDTIQFLCGTEPPEHPARRQEGDERKTVSDRGAMSREIFRTNQELHALNTMLRRQVSQLTILYQMGRDISEKENWSDALDRFLMALVNYIHAEGAALLLFSEEESRLAARSNFQVDPAILSQSCQVLLQNWRKNPRGDEIHAIESYRDMVFNGCLDRRRPWRFTIIPLRHRSRAFGFLFIDKIYGSGHAFRSDYHFLDTLQTILAEEVVNASRISELRQLSRFNKKILDNIQSGVITTDLEGNVRFFNKQAVALCPRISLGQTLHFNDLFISATFGDDLYGKVLRSPKDTHVLGVECARDEDATFPASLSISKMHDDNLNGTVLVAIFEDLTERKKLEREVRRNDRLRVLGQLSASVAHEIRNPLTGIATTVEVLAGKLDADAEKAKYIQVIMEEINRLNEIIRNLLSFARPAKPQIEDFALAGVSERVASMLSDEARKKGVSLDIEDHLTRKNCSADVNQLTQVLLNIVLNSIQACEKGDEVKIVLHTEDDANSEARGYARIDVIDSGVGVPEAIRTSLFEPFVTTKTNGTGLGLAISQQIIEEHRGKISCEFLDKGTCFTIRLPIEGREASL